MASYRPGIRGYFAFLRLPDLLRDGDGIQWAQLLRRVRPSARLRQAEQERAWWAQQIKGVEHPYLSTACWHALHDGRVGHDRCRIECKFCAEPCGCPCHAGPI